MFRVQNLMNCPIWILIVILTAGCDEEAARIAREAADRQAQQNTAMADLNKEVASGAHQLVEADAQARHDIIGVHHDLQSERGRLDSSWNKLEAERRQIAGQRRTESMIVPVTGLLLLVVVLGFCWYAIVAARASGDTSAELNELLIAEILPNEAMLGVYDSAAKALSYSVPDTVREETLPPRPKGPQPNNS